MPDERTMRTEPQSCLETAGKESGRTSIVRIVVITLVSMVSGATGCAEDGDSRDVGATERDEAEDVSSPRRDVADGVARNLGWDAEIDAPSRDVAEGRDALDGGATSDAASATVLAAPEGWRRIDASNDPFEDRPDAVRCEPSGYGVETLQRRPAYALLTERCDYLTVRQPLRHAVDEGEHLAIQLWHFNLTAPRGGEAHLALALEGEILWETRRSIPRDSDLLTARVPAPRALSKGTPLYYHVHNHGQNEYYLFPVTRAE